MPQETINSQTIPPPTHLPASGGSRAFPPALYKIDKGQLAQRIELIRQYNQTLAPEEIYLMFNPADIEKSLDEYFFKGAHFCEVLRNTCILLPLVWSWISLGLAVSAFAETVDAGSANKEFALQSFLYLWAQGFPSVSSVSLTFVHIPIVIQNWHFLSFGDLVFIDALLILFIVATTVVYHFFEHFAQKQVVELRVWIKQEIDELSRQSAVRSLGPGPGNKQPVWAVKVHTAINELQSALSKVESAVLSSEKSFAQTVDRFTDSYQRQDKTVGSLITMVENVNKAIDQLHVIYQQGKDTYQSLEAVLPRIETSFKQVAQYQEQSGRALQSLVTEIGTASSAIDQLARPFAAADLATIAQRTAHNMRYTTEQQQVILEQLVQIISRLSQYPSHSMGIAENSERIITLLGIPILKSRAKKPGR